MTKKGFVLRIAPSGRDRVSEALENDHLIIGWAKAKGLLDQELEWEGFREIIREAYYADAENLRGAGNAGGHMWRFIRAMETGDLVVVPHGSEFYVGEVTGCAFYDENKVDEDSAYRRPVKWLHGKGSFPRAIAKSALVSRMKTRGTSADATDLVEEIESYSKVKDGTKPSFEPDLRRRLIEATLDELRSGRMENFGFERLIETVLRGLGAVDTKIVSRRKDKGIDIYAMFLVAGAFRQVVGVQAKHFQPEPPVGAGAVRQLAHGIEEGPEEEGPEKVTLGMVITSGNFSPEAEAEAKRYEEDKGIPIELVDGEQFAGLIVEHGLEVMR